jgi:hypothetical protein
LFYFYTKTILVFFAYRYRFRRNQILNKEEAEKWGILKKDQSKVTLETEFEKVKQASFIHFGPKFHSLPLTNF